MTLSLKDYEPIVGTDAVDELYRLSEPLRGKGFQHVNSTRVGGGVAEILFRMVPIFQELGLNAWWDVMSGTDEFFRVTKSFHNGLQGQPVFLSNKDFETYLQVNHSNAKTLALTGDMVLIHDPQPAAMIEYYRSQTTKQLFLWRCHIDVSQPDRAIWRFLEGYVRRYRSSIFSAPQFSQRLSIPQFLVPPSIDPLSPKNEDLAPEFVRQTLERFQIDPKRPLIVQISRFDYFKDPVGVIQAYQLAKKAVDCQLVLAGGGATDDPEGAQVLAEVREAAHDDPDVHILELPPRSDREINALQRAAVVVLQKSTREGFGLTVSEALWKGRPVIGGSVGGIPLQVVDGVNGYLVHSPEGAAFRIRYLIQNPETANEMGRRGREHVLNNFLITRHVRQYLLVIHASLRIADRVLYS
jgi:trehalose synthase